MPLTRAHVTLGSQVMLPAYVVFNLWVGTIYATNPNGRLDGSRAFPLFPPEAWGTGFLLFGTVQLVALLTHRRDWFLTALAPMAVWCVFWSMALAWNAAVNDGSYSAPAFPMILAAACVGSMLSLNTQTGR